MATKVVPTAPKVFTTYPAMRYHKTDAPEGRVVNSAGEAATLGDGWVDTPAAFDPNYVQLAPPPAEGTPMDTVLSATTVIIPYPAMRYGRTGAQVTIANADEDSLLSPADWQDHPWTREELAAAPVTPASVDAPPVVTSSESPIAASLYLLNAAEAQLLINGADTPAKLDAIEIAERAHPKHPGGRLSVLRAIEDAREAMAVAPTPSG